MRGRIAAWRRSSATEVMWNRPIQHQTEEVVWGMFVPAPGLIAKLEQWRFVPGGHQLLRALSRRTRQLIPPCADAPRNARRRRGNPVRPSSRLRNARPQVGHISPNRLPYSIEVDVPVSVDESITHTGDGAPRNRGPSRLVLIGQALDGLADDLKVVDDPRLQHFVPPEPLLRVRGLTLDPANSSEDVLDSVSVGPHRGMASANACRRT